MENLNIVVNFDKESVNSQDENTYYDRCDCDLDNLLVSFGLSSSNQKYFQPNVLRGVI